MPPTNAMTKSTTGRTDILLTVLMSHNSGRGESIARASLKAGRARGLRFVISVLEFLWLRTRLLCEAWHEGRGFLKREIVVDQDPFVADEVGVKVGHDEIVSLAGGRLFQTVD